jgi:hypothetical protein
MLFEVIKTLQKFKKKQNVYKGMFLCAGLIMYTSKLCVTTR